MSAKETLGFLTESTILPRKAVAITGVTSDGSLGVLKSLAAASSSAPYASTIANGFIRGRAASSTRTAHPPHDFNSCNPGVINRINKDNIIAASDRIDSACAPVRASSSVVSTVSMTVLEFKSILYDILSSAASPVEVVAALERLKSLNLTPALLTRLDKALDAARATLEPEASCDDAEALCVDWSTKRSLNPSVVSQAFPPVSSAIDGHDDSAVNVGSEGRVEKHRRGVERGDRGVEAGLKAEAVDVIQQALGMHAGHGVEVAVRDNGPEEQGDEGYHAVAPPSDLYASSSSRGRKRARFEPMTTQQQQVYTSVPPQVMYAAPPPTPPQGLPPPNVVWGRPDQWMRMPPLPPEMMPPPPAPPPPPPLPTEAPPPPPLPASV